MQPPLTEIASDVQSARPPATEAITGNSITANRKAVNDVLVSVENVGKIFCRDLKQSLWYGLKDATTDLIPGFGGRKVDANGVPILRPGEFWANQGITFELRRGECLGLIGHNGAGKTTLLKMLNGLIKPDTGSITLRGRVGALIALGAGFNPILTGRENVYIAGTVYGLSKAEIDAKYRDIVDFAELHDFMDTPVQNYSSGMQVRLGFAVASAIDPDVLLIDEVLAVGDAGFRIKCMNRLGTLISKTAVIIISHQMDQITRIANWVAYLNKGRMEIFKDPLKGIQAYESEGAARNQNQDTGVTHIEPSLGNHLTLNLSAETINCGEAITLTIRFEALQQQAFGLIIVNLRDEYGNTTGERRNTNLEVSQTGDLTTITETSNPIYLRPGTYKLSFAVFDETRKINLIHGHSVFNLKICGDASVQTPCIL